MRNFVENFFFSDHTQDITNDDPNLARNKSNFHPQRNRNRTLDTGIDALNNVSRNLKSFNISTAKQNLTHSERKGLKELRNNPNIIIKEADKGGTVCIMDRSFYAQKMKDLLNDPETYVKVQNDNISQTMSKIKKNN